MNREDFTNFIFLLKCICNGRLCEYLDQIEISCLLTQLIMLGSRRTKENGKENEQNLSSMSPGYAHVNRCNLSQKQRLC